MKLSNLFKKAAKNETSKNTVVKVDKKMLAKITGGATYLGEPTKASDASAGKGAKGE